MCIKSNLTGLIFFAVTSFFSANAQSLSVTVKNPTVIVNEGVTQLCHETELNGRSCAPVAVPFTLVTIKKTIQLDQWDGAPYIWISIGRKKAAVCAASENFASENLCINLKVDISSVSISKSSETQLGFSFIARTSLLKAEKLQRKASRFSNSYAKAIEILHAYAQSNWSADANRSVNAKIVAKSAVAGLAKLDTLVSTPKPTDSCGENEDAIGVVESASTVLDCDDDSGEGGGGSGGGDVGGDVGGDAGTGEYGGEYDASNPDPNEIDPDTGLPVPRVIVFPPTPRWPADPSWCSLVGLYCPSAAVSSDEPNKAYCDGQRQLAYRYCTSVYASDPNKLPGSGPDMPSRYRVCVRDFLEGTGCHDY